MTSLTKSLICRCCGSDELLLVHHFGYQPLAGRYPLSMEASRSTKKYPLDLTQCLGCGLLQVTNVPPIEEIFNESYCYSSSTIPDLKSHFLTYSEYLGSKVPAGSRIFEFGCNDGVLLEALVREGYVCAGVDASDNVARIARSKGLAVRTGFLTLEHVQQADLVGKFDLVTCSNVFAHIHDLHSTVDAVRSLLVPGGLFCIEVHDGSKLIEDGQFDTVYHEHLTYFSEGTLRSFLEGCGFEFQECTSTAMHGGGLRMCVRMHAAPQALRNGGRGVVPLRDFIGPKIEHCRTKIEALHGTYGKLDAYGAAGRSQMFINMTDTSGCFGQIFDDSRLRQGRFIAGTPIPVNPFTGAPGSDCCVVLAWNYADSISRRIRQYYSRVVTVLPDLKDW